jgi:hypothetical protein
MPPTRKPNDGLIARVNFPLYSVKMLTSRHILVGGGGGSAKTGINNGFVSFFVVHKQFIPFQLHLNLSKNKTKKKLSSS